MLRSLSDKNLDITVGVVEDSGALKNQLPDYVKVVTLSQLNEHWWHLGRTNVFLRSIIKPANWTKLFSLPYLLLKSKIKGSLLPLYSHYITADKEPPYNPYDIAIQYQAPSEILDYYTSHIVRTRKRWSWIHFDVAKFFMRQSSGEECYTLFDKIMVVSEPSLHSFIKRFPHLEEKTELFHNIVERERIKSLSKQFVPFDKKGGKHRNITTIGRLRTIKGQDIAIEAAAILKKQGYDFDWWMVGDGSSRNELEQLAIRSGISEKIHFTGNQANPYPYILHSDIYVQPSRSEGHSLTVVEARVFNIPIATTGFPTAHTILDGIDNCAVAEGFEPAQLARAIAKIWDTPVLDTDGIEQDNDADRLEKLVRQFHTEV